jgi:hypothetical protein
MSTYAGQTVRIKFLTHDDGFSAGDITGQFIDDVVLSVPCGSPTPTPTPTCAPSAFHVLIVYSDIGGPPTTIQNEILAEPGVVNCDLFDAFSGTPTLAQLTPYNIVVAFSNNMYNDPVGMGNVLADYEDAGGIVVGTEFDWFGTFGLQGRWITGGYSPYNTASAPDFATNTATIHSNCLTQGVTTLTAFFRIVVTLAPGAVSVADWTDNAGSAVAYKVNNGHTAVGINAYLGQNPMNFTGDWGHLIVNAGRCLLVPCGTPTPTPTASPMPTATPTCAPGGGKIYNIAGFGASGQTNTTRIYDIGTNTWTTGAPCPAALSDLATAYWDGKIYVAGGFNGGAANTLYIYDIASNTWTTGPSMPTAVYLPGFGAINGKVYVASGNNGSTEQTVLQVYDIASSTWSTGAPIPTGVTGPASAVFQGKLYISGGAAPFPTTTTMTQIYDPGTNSWTTGPSMVTPRLWFYGGNNDNTAIVAPGGDTTPGTPINDNELFNGTTWSAVAPLPYHARGPFCVSDGTFFYIGGGYDGSSVHTDTLRYDPVANTYTPLAPAPDAHFLSQAVIVPGGTCGSPTPTATATATSTPTATATATATFTPTATATATATPTPAVTVPPRPSPTPRPRPTPPPHP